MPEEVDRQAELVECLAMIRHADLGHFGLTRECDECMAVGMREVYAIDTPGVELLDKKWFWFAVIFGTMFWGTVAWLIFGEWNLPFLGD